jgi:hypothetical protein
MASLSLSMGMWGKGGGAGSGVAPATITYVNRYTDVADVVSPASYTFLDSDIGTPSADRVVVVCVAMTSSGGGTVVGTPTIGGNTMTASRAVSGAGSSNSAGIFQFPMPAGTTATIVVPVASGTAARCGIEIFTITTANSTPVSTPAAGTGFGATQATGNLTVPNGGVGIVFDSYLDGAATASWSASVNDAGVPTYLAIEGASTIAAGFYNTSGSFTPTITVSVACPHNIISVAWGPAPKGFVAEGDSLTIGTGLAGNYPSDMSRNVGIAVAANWAVGGATVPGMNADYPTQGGTSFNAPTANTYLFMGGTNDAGSGVAAATIATNIQTHIGLALATGYKVAVGTVPKRGDNPAAQTILNALNPLIRANYLSWGATWLMDFDAWPTLQNPADTFYYNADQLHFVNPGWLELAKCAQAGIGIPSLSARGANGALRYFPNPPGYKSSGAVPVMLVTTMQTATLGNGSIAYLVNPITAKSVFAFTFVSGVANFTNAGIVTAADVNVDMGFGPALTGGAGWYQSGGVFTGAASPNSGLGGFTNGNTVGVVVDPITKQVWWTKDGTNFIGIGSLATLAQVVAGTNSTAQNWTGPVYGGVGAWSGGISVVANSVPYPWTPPTGFIQL